MSFFMMFIFFIVGILISSVGFVQLIMSILFIKPFTDFLSQFNILLDPKKVKKKSNLTAFFWLLFTLIVTILIQKYSATSSFTAYIIGFIIIVFKSLNPNCWGMTPDNVHDYAFSYENYFRNPQIAEVLQSEKLKEIWIQKNLAFTKHPMQETILELISEDKS